VRDKDTETKTGKTEEEKVAERERASEK